MTRERLAPISVLLLLHSRVATGAVLAALMTSHLGCSPVALGDGEKRIVTRDITNSVVLPTLDAVVEQADALTLALEPLAAEPTPETLATAQQAWRSARAPWKEAEAFAFGPATDLRLGVAFDQSPVDPPKIDEELNGSATIDADYVEGLGANRKGFHALEYLLFQNEDDAAVLALLSLDPLAQRRRELLVAYSQNLEEKTRELRAAWQVEGGNYVTRLTEPGAANPTYPTIKSVVDTFVNESIFLSELIANNKLGKPLGAASGGDPQPDLEESGPSDNSLADMADNLRSIRNVYFGTRSGVVGQGINQLLIEQSPVTHRAVSEALDAAIAAVEAIPRPYRSALVDRQPEVDAAYEAVKALKRVLATDVVAQLGATLKFNDNDGD